MRANTFAMLFSGVPSRALSRLTNSRFKSSTVLLSLLTFTTVLLWRYMPEVKLTMPSSSSPSDALIVLVVRSRSNSSSISSVTFIFWLFRTACSDAFGAVLAMAKRKIWKHVCFS